MDQITAIDPMALLLRGDIYVKIHLPRPVDPSVLVAIVKTMSPAERKAAQENVAALGNAVSAAKRALAEVGVK